jgi:hypothetical protein
MDENTRQKWQEALSEFLEPGERVEAVVRGTRAKYWQLVLLFGFLVVMALKRYRTYVVTDRNVYVFQAGASKYKVTEVLEKRPLGEARVEFNRGYLTLDGAHESFVGIAGPVKRRAVAFAEAASRGAAAPPTPESNIGG